MYVHVYPGNSLGYALYVLPQLLLCMRTSLVPRPFALSQEYQDIRTRVALAGVLRLSWNCPGMDKRNAHTRRKHCRKHCFLCVVTFVGEGLGRRLYVNSAVTVSYLQEHSGHQRFCTHYYDIVTIHFHFLYQVKLYFQNYYYEPGDSLKL